jgi:hypothetical protein
MHTTPHLQTFNLTQCNHPCAIEPLQSAGKLETQFNCPFCNGESTVGCTMDWETNTGVQASLSKTILREQSNIYVFAELQGHTPCRKGQQGFFGGGGVPSSHWCQPAIVWGHAVAGRRSEAAGRAASSCMEAGHEHVLGMLPGWTLLHDDTAVCEGPACLRTFQC